MGFVLYRVLWILQALWIIMSETINILRNLQKKKKKKNPANKFKKDVVLKYFVQNGMDTHLLTSIFS